MPSCLSPKKENGSIPDGAVAINFYMLDPREVRAGNWVLRITGTDTKTNSFFEYKAIAHDEYYFTFAKSCFAIKLTSAILKNCGFKQKPGYWQMNTHPQEQQGGFPLLWFRTLDYSWYLENTRLLAQPQYVHQLQNLYYALSNKELDIRLGQYENISIIGPVNFFIKPPRVYLPTRDIL
jgi:hypothetical protein